MQIMTCTQKFRNRRNVITHYELKDTNGNTVNIEKMELKQAILQGNIAVDNLALTYDNKLVDKKPTGVQIKKDKKSNIEKMILKLCAIGFKLYNISTQCHNLIYLAINSKKDAVLIIPDNVSIIRQKKDHVYLNWVYFDVKTITVYGGKNLKSAYKLFYNCKTESLDLSNFDTRKIENMQSMFGYCRAKTINLSKMDTSRVTNMHGMFEHCSVKNLDLSNFNTENVTDMSDMFEECAVKSINLTSFNTSKVINMSYMFSAVDIKELNLSSFDTKNVRDMFGMFTDSEIQSIDLSNFTIGECTDIINMSYNCKFQSVKLSKDKKLNEILKI